jgi:hypothetical protein
MTRGCGVEQAQRDEPLEVPADDARYEAPRIVDYGTLAELTAGDKEGNDWDIISCQYGRGDGGGGYS